MKRACMLVAAWLCGWGLQILLYHGTLMVGSARPWTGKTDFNEQIEYVLANNNDPLARQDMFVLDALGARPAECVADVGCGTGFHVMHMARTVGERGVVYAVDINPRAVTYVRERARVLGFHNVRTIQSTPQDACLPAESVDRILLANVLHCFLNAANQDDDATFQKQTRPFLTSMWRALRPGGRLLVVDFAPMPPPNTNGGSGAGGVSGASVKRDFQRCGYRLVRADGDERARYMQLYERPH